MLKKTVKISLAEKTTKELQTELQKLRHFLVESTVKHHSQGLKDSSVFKKSKAEIGYIHLLLSKIKPNAK